MEIITGEKIQELATAGFSKLDQKEFESKNAVSYDIESFDFNNYDNPDNVYCNSSLINEDKPALKDINLYDKLSKFKNPFNLILHNSDQSFDETHKKYFNIPNIKKIYTQNVNTTHERLIPLPIGLANSNWPWGNIDAFDKELKTLPKEKSKFIFFNFKINGGLRDDYRPQCYKAGKEKGLEWTEDTDFKSYIKDLKNYKYCLSPEGNGIDCHRMWECLYLKVIPICHKNVVTEYFAKIFPIVLVNDWQDLDLEYLDKHYNSLNNWPNYYLLDLDLYTKKLNLNG